VSARRAGRYTYYQVTDPRVAEIVAVGAEIVADHAASIAACTKVGRVGGWPAGPKQ
jgi:hypothetical protein